MRQVVHDFTDPTERPATFSQACGDLRQLSQVRGFDLDALRMP
jgi:hypothetical protein